MLWVFIIIGLLTSGSVLYRLAGAVRKPGLGTLIDTVALALLALAWTTEHMTATGWGALLMALGIQLLRWFSAGASTFRPSPRESSAAQTPAVPSERAAAPDVPVEEAGPAEPLIASGQSAASRAESNEGQGTERDADDAAAVSPEPVGRPSAAAMAARGARPTAETTVVAEPRRFTTIALLPAPWEAAGEVFLASLRRAGQRDAELLDDQAEDRIRIRIGEMTLELVGIPEPVGPGQLEYAITQNWDWPEASGSIASHVAHIVLTTERPPSTPSASVLGLHHRIHRALAEFAPVLAVLWPDAGRLVPAVALKELGGGGDDGGATATSCVSFRVFALEGSEAGSFVSDTVGLHGLGLPDIQVVSRDEPGASVSAVVYELADRVLAGDLEIGEEDQAIAAGDGGRWRVVRARSRFGPDREVLDLSQVGQEADEAAGERDAGG